MAEYIECKALLKALKEERKNGNFVFTSKWIKEIMDNLPKADVVPKSIFELWKQNAEKLAEENDALKDSNEHLAVMLMEAKTDVAREIFEEIEKLSYYAPTPYDDEINVVDYEDIAALKKKYTEEEWDENQSKT
jgi:hypothetical protein